METTGVSRRHLVLGAGALSASVLSGCASMQGTAALPSPARPPVPEREVQDADVVRSGLQPFLVTREVLCAWAAPQRYFDAHTHFFNARDVPVKDFISKSFGHEVPGASLRWMLGQLAQAAEDLSHDYAPSVKAEMIELRELSSATPAALAQRRDLDRAIEERRSRVADELLKRLPTGSLTRMLQDHTPSGQPVPSVEEFMHKSVQGEAAGEPDAAPMSASWRDRMLERLLKPRDEEIRKFGGLVAGIAALLSPRHHNLRTFIQKSAEGSPQLRLSGCFAAMVDFNYWLKHPKSISHMRDQVLLHEQLSLLSGGFLLPVVGYNPWVDITQPGNAALGEAFETLRWAVEEHGCVGAKIYPSMGFHPYGNVLHTVNSRNERPAADVLDERLEAFWRECARLQIPVMAHANDSLGRDDAHDGLGGERGWRALAELLRRHGTRLNVNLGHFGGTENGTKRWWQFWKEHKEPWAEPFAALMGESSNLGVYADIGHWEDMLPATAGAEQVRQMLRPLLTRPLGETGQTVANRIMYGSDWHMLAKVNGWPTYGQAMLHVFAQDFGLKPEQIAAVFGGNVLDCYGLSPSSTSANRLRLQRHFETFTGRPPGWMAPGTASLPAAGCA